ncbi:hypothetical protein B0T10DRAFT_556604 [Thelonectria olida]|uniref:Uncharacterized protein n=1 Tax=Thelonectria olida TaxID=1576542 RepID=A0A9P8WH07_9HYPO|nr:hypothetical protein B0T10DRAFT_556604 [Thelonectria olida]
MMSHLHELVDARLFSVHPDTLQVRAFVPYNVLIPYNGQEATVPDNMNREALRHDYDTCCTENMGAEMPMLECIPAQRSMTPFSPKTDLPAAPTWGFDSSTNLDPAKRSRPSEPDQPRNQNIN